MNERVVLNFVLCPARALSSRTISHVLLVHHHSTIPPAMATTSRLLFTNTRNIANTFVPRTTFLRCSRVAVNTIRFQSTSAPSESGRSSTPNTPPPQTPEPPKSKHKLVYREIWPPLIRVLAYSSGVYFALHLGWQYLDGQEQRQLEQDVRAELEAQIRSQINEKGNQAKSNGWWSWLTGSQKSAVEGSS